IDQGIDIVTHSGTKYIGGHSDLCCGVVVASKKITQKIKASAVNFGGMLSFEVKGDPEKLMKKLNYIKRAVSLGGVESSINTPARTSHAKLSLAERKAAGISDKLLRLSVGIEETEDLINDLKNGLGA
ncbi:MAG TPA: PLP-dependent transferase, partial [Cyclobacteriaceae bacterium]|nr:PLP-dependent transferase [Cyclobacteriaceae bacterium]